jgi:hypothetical protein
MPARPPARLFSRFVVRLRRLLHGYAAPGKIQYVPARDIADPGWEKARTIPTARSDLVRSWGEARVADWLHARGIRYEYEPLVAGRRPDFYLPDLGVIVEYSGVEKEEYERRHAERMAAYRKARIPVIALRGKRWDSLEREAEDALRRWGWEPVRRP